MSEQQTANAILGLYYKRQIERAIADGLMSDDEIAEYRVLIEGEQPVSVNPDSDAASENPDKGERS